MPQPPRHLTTTTSHSLAIAAQGLRKAYGDKTVLDGIDLAVPAGNGLPASARTAPGKTTAVKILSTLITPPTPASLRVAATTSPPTPGRTGC